MIEQTEGRHGRLRLTSAGCSEGSAEAYRQQRKERTKPREPPQNTFLALCPFPSSPPIAARFNSPSTSSGAVRHRCGRAATSRRTLALPLHLLYSAPPQSLPSPPPAAYPLVAGSTVINNGIGDGFWSSSGAGTGPSATAMASSAFAPPPPSTSSSCSLSSRSVGGSRSRGGGSTPAGRGPIRERRKQHISL